MSNRRDVTNIEQSKQYMWTDVRLTRIASNPPSFNNKLNHCNWNAEKKRAKTNCKTNNNLELAIEWKIAAVNSLLKEGLTYLDSKVDNDNNKNSDKLKNRKFNYDFLCVTITSLLSYAERKRKEENAVFNKSIFLFLPWWSSLCSLI